jgi:HEAT repeat protein
VDRSHRHRFAVQEGAVRVEVPIQVTYELVSKEEEAQQKAEADKRAKDGAELVKELSRPVTVAELPEIFQCIQSEDIRKSAAARSRLRTRSHQPGDRSFTAALEKYLDHDNDKVREAAAEAFAACATTDNLRALLTLLDSDSRMIRHYAIQALGRLQSPAAADRLVELLAKGDVSVLSALMQIGPAVEPAMLKLFSQGDQAARQNALQVLSQVGTKRSLPVLEKARKDPDPLSKFLLESTIQNIQRRQ